jgi:hypothetical protein
MAHGSMKSWQCVLGSRDATRVSKGTRRMNRSITMRICSAVTAWILCWSPFTAAGPAWGQSLKTDSEEPTTEMVRSGTCVVDVCSSVDMGDYTFRYYAKEPTATTLQFIPKGGCQCKAVRLTKLKRDFVRFDAVGEDGNTLRLISIVFAIDRRRHVPHGKTDLLNDLSARSDGSALTTLLCSASGIFAMCSYRI